MIEKTKQKFIIEIERPDMDAKTSCEELYEIIGKGLKCFGWDIKVTECTQYLKTLRDTSIKSGYELATTKACEYLQNHIDIDAEIRVNEDNEPLAKSYIDYAMERHMAIKEILYHFKKHMYD